MQRLALLGLIYVLAGPSTAMADGFLSRIRGQQQRAAAPTHFYGPSGSYRLPAGGYPTRSFQRGRTRLPAGRSYYQGRYYGNFNNRFYGPQYGYF